MAKRVSGDDLGLVLQADGVDNARATSLASSLRWALKPLSDASSGSILHRVFHEDGPAARATQWAAIRDEERDGVTRFERIHEAHALLNALPMKSPRPRGDTSALGDQAGKGGRSKRTKRNYRSATKEPSAGAMLSVSELVSLATPAATVGALRKRLERWRKQHDKGWSERADRRGRESLFLYEWASVKNIVRPPKRPPNVR